MTEASNHTVAESRDVVRAIIEGRDPRMLAVVGPCSIHDPEAAYEYAKGLKALHDELNEQLYIVMRVYFEKPRTKLGWRGLILDPHLDGSNAIEQGLTQARKVLLGITGIGLPAGSEMLDPIVPQYIDDLVTWASIGARTTESQTHRDMASGLSMPVGFKNGTDGDIRTAVNALSAAQAPHSFIGIDQAGRTSVLHTTGNPHGHVILRGGKSGPNYHDEAVEDALAICADQGLSGKIVVDCSHGNSRKEPARQPRVLRSVVRQRVEGNASIIGFMLESNIHEGRQNPAPPSELSYGVSITDACMSLETSAKVLRDAAAHLCG